jgi:hypothetical protein
MFKSVFKPTLALAAILAVGSLSLSTQAFAARGGGGGGHGGGGHGGGAFHGGGGGHPGAAIRSGGFTAHPGFAIRRGPVNFHRGVVFHRPFVHRRFVRGFRFYPYYAYGCYRWRHVLTPFGWRLRRVNVCYPYYGQYYY